MNETMSAAQAAAETCPRCHLPVRSEFYFCPNCGERLHVPPPATDALTQVGIYLFSVILPVIAFIAVTKWPGFKYMQSKDPAARLVGFVALALLIGSTIITYWLAAAWISQSLNSALSGGLTNLN